jgi:hypothetical protein
MSLDERWLYVGAPDINAVYAYGRVDWQDQYVRTLGDGATLVYSIADAIQISADTQVEVIVDGTRLILGTDYTVSVGLDTVTFTTAPAEGALVNIQRINLQELDANVYYGVTGTVAPLGGTAATFTVDRQRGTVSVAPQAGGTGYSNGNTITILATSFGGGVDGVNNITFTVTSVTGTGAIETISPVSYTPPALAAIFDLSTYFFTVDNINSFTVTVNDVIQRPNIDYVYSAFLNSISFLTVPGPGTTIVVRAKGYFEYVATIDGTAYGAVAGDRFGSTISCSTDGRQVLIGAPNTDV